MPLDASKVARLERELVQAKAQLLQEDGERFRILWREISDAEKRRIFDGLTERHERVLFGLDAPTSSKRRDAAAGRPARSGGTEVCPVCHKEGLTPRGLSLHMTRIHKVGREEEQAA